MAAIEPTGEDDEQTLRLKSAMILFALERQLGDFVIDKQADIAGLPSALLRDVEARLAGTSDGKTERSVRAVIEETYLSEIFHFAVAVASGTSVHGYLKRLRALCEALDLYAIRNSVSHPNRKFPRCFWHRMATIATDPLIDILGLSLVYQAYEKARRGVIDPPPNDWMLSSAWELPNNLPRGLDHQITGLIGRDVEARQLGSLLANPRASAIAVTGPGGIGKTAVVLDKLSEVVRDPSSQEWCEAVCFCSFKTETLTASGLSKQQAAKTLEGVRSQIAGNISAIFSDPEADWSQVQRTYGNRKVLLFLDNLETLLRDQPDQFERFSLDLPQPWRVVATSRIRIEGAFALPIGELKHASGLLLARTYANRTGAAALSEKHYEQIVQRCNCNPLAIRLSIDRYNLGHQLPESLSLVSAEVDEYSYRNLVEVLSDDSVKVLECLFLTDSAMRSDLVATLDTPIEVVTDALRELLRTSLISRATDTDVEIYSLNPSIRRLLTASPRNIGVRAQIQKALKKKRESTRSIDTTQAQLGISPFDIRYIPNDADHRLKQLVHQANRILCHKKPRIDDVGTLLRTFEENREHFHGVNLYHRTMARILACLGDRAGWTREFEAAIAAEPTDFVSRQLFGYWLTTVGEYARGVTILKSLLDEGAGRAGATDSMFAARVVKGYLFCLLYERRFEDILAATTNWKEAGELRGIYGSFRAQALKREVETFPPSEYEKITDNITRAIRILSDCAHEGGYTVEIAKAISNTISDIDFRLASAWFSSHVSEVTKQEWLTFVDQHLHAATIGPAGADRFRRKVINSLGKVAVPDNPLRSQKWEWLREEHGSLQLSDIQLEGPSVAVSVYHIPDRTDPKNRKFLFASDTDGRQYFVHFSALETQDWEEWLTIEVGSLLSIVPDDKWSDLDKTRPVLRLRLIDKNDLASVKRQ